MLGEAAFSPSHTRPAVQDGVQRKLTSHLAGCQSVGVEFIPIVVKTLGVLAEDTIHVIRLFGEAIAQRVGPQDSATCTKHLFHRVATALWPPFGCIA